AGGTNLRTAETISNLDAMFRDPGSGDNHNATVFADCYGRMGDIIPELVREGRHPRVMLDYSGELLYGLRKMGRGDVLERLRGVTCDPHLRRHVRSEEHTSELQSLAYLVCRLLLEKKKQKKIHKMK